MTSPLMDSQPLERALLVQEPWAGYLVDGLKEWELRGSACNIRGRIGIAVKGQIIGEVRVVQSMKIAERDSSGRLTKVPGNEGNFPLLAANLNRHRLEDFGRFPWKQWHAWVVTGAMRYSPPMSYQQKQGRVNWVRLSDDGNKSQRPQKRPAATDAASTPRRSRQIQE